jgi:hypothetical protein
MPNVNINVGLPTPEDGTLTKKGTVRKRKPKRPQVYFTQDTEDAILEYVATEDQIKRNEIYRTRIDYAFKRLTEAIIHTFKFYYTEVETIKELQHEVIAFLIGKLQLFNHSKSINDRLNKLVNKVYKTDPNSPNGYINHDYKSHEKMKSDEITKGSFPDFTNNSKTVTQEQIDSYISRLKVSPECWLALTVGPTKLTPPKAFSYFGTIVKRYLIIYNNKNYGKLVSKAEVKEVDTDNSIYNTIVLEEVTKELDLNRFIEQFVTYVDNNLYEFFPKKNETRIVDSILRIMQSRVKLEEDKVPFNKKAIYIMIREMTDIATPQITKVIKKLEEYYIELYNEYYKNGNIPGF